MNVKTKNVAFDYDSEAMLLIAKVGDDFEISASQLATEVQSLFLGIKDEICLTHRDRPLSIKGDGVLNPIVMATTAGLLGQLLPAIAIYDYQTKQYIVCTSNQPRFRIGSSISPG